MIIYPLEGQRAQVSAIMELLIMMESFRTTELKKLDPFVLSCQVWMLYSILGVA